MARERTHAEGVQCATRLLGVESADMGERGREVGRGVSHQQPVVEVTAKAGARESRCRLPHYLGKFSHGIPISQ